MDPGGVIPFRASDVPGAIRLFEELRVALENHCLNKKVHKNLNATGLRTRGSYCARLTRAWNRVVQKPLATPPDRTNSGAVSMILAGGFR